VAHKSALSINMVPEIVAVSGVGSSFLQLVMDNTAIAAKKVIFKQNERIFMILSLLEFYVVKVGPLSCIKYLFWLKE
jgi:hypothetical protein